MAEDEKENARDEKADEAPPALPPANAVEKPKKKSNPMLGIVGFVLALGGGFFLGQWINNRGKGDVEIEEGPRYRIELRGDEPTMGPADALVTIIEFADYQCPYCANAVPPLEDVLEDEPEDVRLIYKHYPLPMHAKATPAARAAWAGMQQGKFWELHHWLFEKKADMAQLDAKIAELGLDRDRFLRDMAGEEAGKVVDGDMLAGAKVGVSGTPVFFVNGHRYVGIKTAPQWRSIVDAEREEAERLVRGGTPRAQVFDALMSDALARAEAPKGGGGKPDEHDPTTRYAVDAADRPAMGPDDALVTVVIFSDFQCPFCAKSAPVAHQLIAQHPDVRVVFRNLPLEMHPRAREAAKAALAAGRQGKFWEMHDALFAAQDRMADLDFAAFASEVGLDATQFAADFADPALDRQIAEDEAIAARLRVRGTPAAFINGKFMRGAQPLAAFSAKVDEERAAAQALVDAGTARADVYAELMKTAQQTVAAPEGG
ncbi:MAG TPA: thioredoxin domain-containing protein [Nannocystaceae bacterium]|nr:thioredoxin domain-containing protein [Nannocystaceae bacterium]